MVGSLSSGIDLDARWGSGRFLAAIFGILRGVPGTSSRLLSLLSLLQTRRDWSGVELAERLGVSGRTIRRDVDRLRELGYPIDAVSGPAGGYRLRAGAAMPPLLLDDDEAVAIAVGLRAAAGAAITGIEETSVRALVKLEQILPSRLRRRVRALQSATVMVRFAPSSAPIDPETLTVIAGACRDHERLRFAYVGRGGAESRRYVEPHSLVSVGHRWYLVGWDRDREDWRTFRVDRLSAPFGDASRFEPRGLPGGDPAAFVTAHMSSAPYRYQARLRLLAPAADVRATLPPWGGEVREVDASSCELRTSDDSLEWLVARLGMLRFEFVVLEPAELRDRLRVVAERFHAAAK
jgi:predicted DNA-binding transcriptional regulator YafY